MTDQAFAVVVAGGDLTPSASVLHALQRAHLVVAADSGALRLANLGREPNLLVGDFDSLTSEQVAGWRERGVEVVAWDPHKDHTDGELAVRAAIERGFRHLVLLGWLGGDRADHELANLLLLGNQTFADVDLRVIDGELTIQPVRRTATIAGQSGDLVTLLPIGGPVTGARLSGFEYPLEGEMLQPGETRGVSNRLLATAGVIETDSGVLLAFHYHHGSEGRAD